MNSLRNWLDKIPPFAYRLLAKTKVAGIGGSKTRFRSMSSQDIADRSGLSKWSIDRLSSAMSWGGITISTADKFIYGCGFDPLKTFRTVQTLKRISRSKNGVLGARHLAMDKRLPLWERRARKYNLIRLKKVLEKMSNEKGNANSYKSGGNTS